MRIKGAEFLFNTCLLEQFFDHSCRLGAVLEPLLSCLDIYVNSAGICVGVVVSDGVDRPAIPGGGSICDDDSVKRDLFSPILVSLILTAIVFSSSF